MTYKVKVEPAHVREAQISDQLKVATKEAFYEFQNRKHDLDVIALPIGTPIYRMANFRTRIAQQSYLRRESKPADFFRNGQENESAQQVQHNILVKFAEQGREGSVTPIIEVLETERQRGNLLITSRGVVVNGNRRLAAMRALYDKSINDYREFSHVQCLVLPPSVTETEIVEIEIRLQMKQRTELQYDWVNECIAIKELRDSGKSTKELMALMNKKKGDIEDALNALTEADLYLSDWLGRPADYDAIDDAKQLFYNIGDSLVGKSGEALELGRRIAWTLVDNRSSLKRRVYDFNPMFGKKAEEVGQKLAESFGLDLTTASEAESKADDGDFDVDISAPEETSFRPLIELFDDAARRTELASQLVEVSEGILEAEKGRDISLLPLNTLQKINGQLAGMDITRASPASLPAIAKQIETIEGHVTRLRAFIDQAAVPEEGT